MADLLEHELSLVWEELVLHQHRRGEAREAIERLYDEARVDDPQFPEPQQGVFSRAASATKKAAVATATVVDESLKEALSYALGAMAATPLTT